MLLKLNAIGGKPKRAPSAADGALTVGGPPPPTGMEGAREGDWLVEVWGVWRGLGCFLWHAACRLPFPQPFSASLITRGSRHMVKAKLRVTMANISRPAMWRGDPSGGNQRGRAEVEKSGPHWYPEYTYFALAYRTVFRVHFMACMGRFVVELSQLMLAVTQPEWSF